MADSVAPERGTSLAINYSRSMAMMHERLFRKPIPLCPASREILITVPSRSVETRDQSFFVFSSTRSMELARYP
jgi:hypothetical protein